MKIGTTIKETRILKGLSQKELAGKITISPTSLSLIENDVKHPSKATLKKLSVALKVPEVYFYLSSLDKEDVPDENRNLYDVIYPSIKEMVKKLIT